jgi:spore coat polysaccharide biosynthesis protein SpsF
MNSAIFITIRKDSSRLPNKAVMDMYGSKVMEMIIKRAKLAKNFEQIIVCTTTRPIDDEIEEVAIKEGAKVFRGSLEDKLERWNGAAKKYAVDYVVTFDGDDLFCDPELLDLGAEQIASDAYDFIEAPDGLVCGAFTYAFSTKALEEVCSIKASDDTEMMWTYFKDSGRFRCGKLSGVDDVFYRDYRMTLDYQEDYEFFLKVFQHFKCVGNDVPLRDIVAYLDDNPDIPKINHFRQQEFLDNQRRKTKLVLKNDNGGSMTNGK